jgi:copper homeostasis protein CutC
MYICIATNVAQLIRDTGIREVHGSARQIVRFVKEPQTPTFASSLILLSVYVSVSVCCIMIIEEV